MPEEKDPPRPHGDKLEGSVRPQTHNPDENQAQIRSDATPDAVAAANAPGREIGSLDESASTIREETDRDDGQGSTANGVPAFDEDDGKLRKRQYRDGADLVSGLD